MNHGRSADYHIIFIKNTFTFCGHFFSKLLIGPIDLEKYLDGVEAVTVGGESDRYARPLYYDWVLDIRQQCIRKKVNFSFRQLGTHFIKDGKEYTVQVKKLMSQAQKAGIDVNF